MILSGGPSEQREYAGVGFIVAPWARQAVINFIQHSNRLASLQIRVSGGSISVICAYAPQSGLDFDIRHAFFSDMHTFTNKVKAHGPTYTIGDFNSRFHEHFHLETDVVGPFAWGNPDASITATSNQHLLIEHCSSLDLVVANTFINRPVEKRVTYYDLAAKPMDAIAHNKFAELDHVLTEKRWQSSVTSVTSNRALALASHHFMLTIELELDIPKTQRKQRSLFLDRADLQNPNTARHFTTEFLSATTAPLQSNSVTSPSLDNQAGQIAASMFAAASKCLEQREVKPNRPWIRRGTLDLIELRNQARINSQHQLELSLNKLIKQSAKQDRKEWLNDMMDTGDWSNIRKFKRRGLQQQGRLRDASGELVDSESRTETMACYYSTTQWMPPPLGKQLPNGPRLGPELPVNVSSFTAMELDEVLAKLRAGKAAGTDEVPPDFWKALRADKQACQLLLDLCSDCWLKKDIPELWRHATVSAIFKKGDESLPKNYRPISLLTVGYKVLAALILARLVSGGAEDRLRKTQFGFRKARGAADAVFLVQRLIEKAWATKDGKLSAILLDWSKAFDRVDPAALLIALSRFGVPSPLVDMVAAIYRNRTFAVREGQNLSTIHPQGSGIAQGCPLSPYLFIIMLSVLFADVDQEVRQHRNATQMSICSDITYADDTALVSDDLSLLQLTLNCLINKAALYGLEPNWDKTLHLQIRHNEAILMPSGDAVKPVDSATYLGSLLSADGWTKSSVARRTGEARSVLDKLQTVWRHANITRKRKLDLFNACVVSKLLYSLETLCLRQADRDRLDAFQAQALRKIMGIPHSMLSHVSNQEVRRLSRQRPLSQTILFRQLSMFGRISAMPDDSVLRDAVFKPGSISLTLTDGKRSRGRPRLRWETVMHAHALQIVNMSNATLSSLLGQHVYNQQIWQATVKHYCFPN